MHSTLWAVGHHGGERRACAEDGSDEAGIVDEPFHERLVGDHLYAPFADICLRDSEPLDREAVVGMAVGVYDGLEGQVAEPSQVGEGVTRDGVVEAGVDDDHAIVADDHGG